MHDRPHPSRSPQTSTARTALTRIGQAPAKGLAAGVALVRIVRLARLSRLDDGTGDSFLDDRMSARSEGSTAPARTGVPANVH